MRFYGNKGLKRFWARIRDRMYMNSFETLTYTFGGCIKKRFQGHWDNFGWNI